LVVATKFRQEIMEMAHGTRLAAQLRSKKMTEKACCHFFSPGLRHEMKEFCQACKEYQHGARPSEGRSYYNHSQSLMNLSAV